MRGLLLALLVGFCCAGNVVAGAPPIAPVYPEWSLRHLMASNTNSDSVPPQGHIIGGESMSDPCCVKTAPGLIDCFIQGSGGDVLQQSISYGDRERKYSGWSSLGGIIIRGVECISRDTGIIDVLVLGTNNALFIKTYSDGKWSNWISKGGGVLEVPSCSSADPRYIQCVLRGMRNSAYYIQSVNGKWGGYVALGGVLRAPLAGTARSPNQFNIYGAGTNNRLYSRYYNGRSWNGWRDMGGLIKERPGATSYSDQVLVDVIGMDNGMFVKEWVGGWSNYVATGGQFVSTPTCLYLTDKTKFCFGVGKDSTIKQNYFDGTKWAGWKCDFAGYNFHYTGTPSCIFEDTTNEVICYVQGHARNIFEFIYYFGNGNANQ